MKTFEYQHVQLKDAARWILDLLRERQATVAAFYGELGAGKTTLIKAICDLLGVVDNVQSPSFAIVNQYITVDGGVVYHFDFYRLKNLQEALDVGAEEYFYSGDICLIEWPEIVESILPEDTVKVKIEIIDQWSRRLTVD